MLQAATHRLPTPRRRMQPPAGGDAPADQEWGFESEFEFEDESESEDFVGDLFGRAKDWVDR